MNDTSSSGILIDAFEAVNDHFTSFEPMGTHGHYVLTRAKRYGRWYCLKALAAQKAGQAAYREMLVKEFEIMMSLQHAGVVQAYSLETVDELGECIVMEWIDGVTLKEWLQGDTTREQRRQAALQLMDALAYIHSHGVAHRDIKPTNVMIATNGMSVKIIDFGLADTDMHAVLKQPAGTMQYMAPEQATVSAPDVRNDIYSLGMVLKQMNLGRKWNRPIARCLRPIDERYQSIEELLADLSRRAARRRLMGFVAAAFGIVAMVTGSVAITNHLNSTKTASSERVDSLNNQLIRTSTVVDQSLHVQDSLVKRLTALNDSLATLNDVNAVMRGEQQERIARQQMVDAAIAEGIRRIDAMNASTGIQHHLDTLTKREYLWIDWNYLSHRGREKALPEYMIAIRNRFNTKELAEIEYALQEHCTHYETRLQQIILKKKGWIYKENYKAPR